MSNFFACNVRFPLECLEVLGSFGARERTRVEAGVSDDDEERVVDRAEVEERLSELTLSSADGAVKCVDLPSSEHAIMLSKAAMFEGQESPSVAAIAAAATPAAAKRLGRAVTGFNEDIWRGAVRLVARFSLRLKVVGSPSVARRLAGTGSAYLVEASPRDAIWGAGLAYSEKSHATFQRKAWPGQNILGESLMAVREEVIGRQ
jgi:ribA/ribD-fused uncharacterized protein